MPLADLGLTSQGGTVAIRVPDGSTATLPAGAEAFAATDAPGIYQARVNGTDAGSPRSFAVNLDPSESRTGPLPSETLEQLGARLAGTEARQALDAEALRQMQTAELEGRQKLWRWLVSGHDRPPPRRNLAGGPGRSRSTPSSRLDSGDLIAMMNRELQTALDRVNHRVVARRRNLWLAVALLAWVIYAALVLVAPATTSRLPRFSGLAILAVIGVLSVLWEFWQARDRVRIHQSLAERIEARFPNLDSRLVTAIGGETRRRPGEVVGYLPSAVVRETLEHRARHDWTLVVPIWQRRGLLLVELMLLGLAVFLASRFPNNSTSSANATPVAAVEGPATPADIAVDPGNTEVERGSPLLVVARFRNNVPGSAQLVIASEQATEPTPSTSMTRSLEDPTFAGRIESVDRAINYRVAFDGGTSPTYSVKVFTFPEVRKVNAHLAYPSYTGLESKTLVDVRHVTAVEGTTLGLNFQLNKEVAQAQLIDEKGQATPLELLAGSNQPNQAGEVEPTYQVSWILADSHRYKVELIDRDGRKNKAPTELAVNVTINRPATVVLSAPGKDARVSPVEELRIQAKTADDFGVVRHGVNFTPPGLEESVDLVLDPGSPAAKKRVADHLLAFEAMKAQPDQLVSYHFWAEDIGPDNQTRRDRGRPSSSPRSATSRRSSARVKLRPAVRSSNSNSNKTRTVNRPEKTRRTPKSRSSPRPGHSSAARPTPTPRPSSPSTPSPSASRKPPPSSKPGRWPKPSATRSRKPTSTPP